MNEDALAELMGNTVEVATAYASIVDTEARYPREAMDAVRRQGLLQLLVPPDLGGRGGSLPLFVEVVRRLAQACGSTALCYTMHVGAQYTLVHQSHVDYVAGLVRRLCETGETCSIAVSPVRGPDGVLQPLHMRRVAGGYRLDGQRAWCTGAVASDALLVYVTATEDQTGPAPALLWVRPRETPGLQIVPAWNGTGMRGSCSDLVIFDNVFVAQADLLGGEERGGAVLVASDVPTLVGLAAASLGTGEAAVRAGAAALAVRLKQSTAPPAVALELASADMALRAAAAAIHSAASAAVIDPIAARPAILAAKAFTNLSVATAADAAMAAGGASAYQRGASLERHWRDAHAGRVMVPTPDECRVALVQHLLGWS